MGSQCVLATGAGEEQHGTSPGGGGGGGLSHKISPLLSGLHRDSTLRPQTAQLSRTARHYAHVKAYPRRRPALRARTKEGWSTSDLRGEDSGGVLPEGRRAGAGVGSDWSGGVFFFFRNVARVSDLQGKGGNVKKTKKKLL